MQHPDLEALTADLGDSAGPGGAPGAPVDSAPGGRESGVATPHEADPAAHRRPTPIELASIGLMVCAVALNVVAMTQTYFTGQPDLVSQPDQAVLYSILAGGWALAVLICLLGPSRFAVGAALAVGIAATELGFRVSDLGGAFKVGLSQIGPGLWLMTAGWVAGAAGAAIAASSARARLRRGDAPPPAVLEGRYERTSGWILAVVALGLAVGGFFLPPWDHYQLTATVTGVAKSINLGNGLSGPWEIVLGNIVVVIALAVSPVVAVLLRHRPAGAALVCGSLLVLAAQMAAAVVQVDQAVSPDTVGIGSSTAQRLGLVVNLSLTTWFALDALSALVLFTAIMYWATARVVQANSSGSAGSAPDARSSATAWPS